MGIRLWRGYHNPELQDLISESWQKSSLLILCPPHLEDFGFLRFFPEEAVRDIELAGEWDEPTVHRLQSAAGSITDFSPAAFPSTPVFGVFTSGTVSGAPRLVLYSKLNVQSSLASIRSVFDTRAFTDIFCYPQPTHTFGLTLGYVQAHLYGLRLIPVAGKYSRKFHEVWMSEVSESTLTLGTPVHFFDLIDACASSRFFPPRSYSCIVGGAKCSSFLWNNLRELLNIHSPSVGYGATEASPGLAHLPPGQVPEQDGDLGEFLPGLKAEIIPGQGVEFEGPNACMAYIQKNEIHFPEKILIRDELKRAASGRLIFEGRTELTLNRGGIKIPLEKMEEVLALELGLAAICVIMPHPRLGEELGVVARSSGVPSEKIFAILTEKFRQNFEKKNIVFVESLPSTANSKADRARATRLLQSHLGKSDV